MDTGKRQRVRIPLRGIYGTFRSPTSKSSERVGDYPKTKRKERQVLRKTAKRRRAVRGSQHRAVTFPQAPLPPHPRSSWRRDSRWKRCDALVRLYERIKHDPSPSQRVSTKDSRCRKADILLGLQQRPGHSRLYASPYAGVKLPYRVR